MSDTEFMADELEATKQELASARDDVMDLRAEVEELRKDKERLDWMDSNGDHANYYQNYLESACDEDGWSIGGATDKSLVVDVYSHGKTIREAVDKAMSATIAKAEALKA